MNQSINDGGPAFPVIGHSSGDEDIGMSLRDYFAGQALAGIYANSSDAFLLAMGAEAVRHGEKRQSTSFAREAYEAADAMIAARRGVVQQSDETPKG